MPKGAVDSYVSLHRHDGYSFFDGMDTPERAAKRAAQMGQPALALTNHGNLYGLIEHYKACRDAGIKPIMGCEFYVTEGEEKPEDKKLNHLTVLAENAVGYRNLNRMAMRAHEYFYRKPRVPFSLLEELREGLIVFSGCPSSPVQRALLAGDEERAMRLLKRLEQMFRGSFYVEIQHHALARKTARWLWDAAEELGAPVVATNDAHYVDKADRSTHDTLLGLRRKGKGEEDPTYGEGFWMPTRSEFAELLGAHKWMTKKQIARMLDETVRIAERTGLELERPTSALPPLWEDSKSKLRRLAVQGMRDRGFASRRDYVERLRQELSVVEKLGYVDYFHVCYEVTSKAKQEDILIGPRGSVCGSLLAYVLGVTTVDPLVHGTMFERFLHEQRTKMPDVDLDIDSRHRERLVGWVLEHYKPYAIPILTFGRYGGGNIAGDLNKLYPELYSASELEEIKFAVGAIKKRGLSELTEEEIEQDPQLGDLMERGGKKGLKRLLTRLFNQPIYVGRHPGGVCFVPSDHEQWFSKEFAHGRWTTSCDYKGVEGLGLLKFDFLGLAAMSTIAETIAGVKRRHGEDVKLADISLEDGSILQEFVHGYTVSIFQYETRGARSILSEIEPDTFQELAACTALNRPGAITRVKEYADGKMRMLNRGERQAGSFGETYGVVVYQEQVLRLLRALGLEWRETDAFLKRIQTTYAPASLEKEIERTPVVGVIIERLVARGVSKKQAKELVDRVMQYSFNKAHAIGYAMVAYWMMWLRKHYPLEYWVATLNSEQVVGKQIMYEGAAIGDGCVLLPPHINGSVGYSVDGNAIRVGLVSIPGIGQKLADAIAKSQPFERPRDLMKIPKRTLNRRALKTLVEAGAVEMRDEQYRAHAVKYNLRRAGKLAGEEAQ